MNEKSLHPGRPTEGWIRDLIFDNPWPLINALCATIGEEHFPEHGIKRFKEFQTPTGPCDLLLAWADHVLVVETKRDEIDEDAVAQCLRYMGAFRVEFCDLVYGVVCAPSISRNALYIMEAVAQSGLQLFYHKLSFSHAINSSPVMAPCGEFTGNQLDVVYEVEETEGTIELQASIEAVEQDREIVAVAGELPGSQEEEAL